MEHPAELRYTSEHEWVRLTGADAAVGITDFAQDALGDVVFVELPEVGLAVGAGDVVCEVESTKSVSEIYAPVEGIVSATNEALVDDPGLLNTDPYGAGWIFRITVADPTSVDALLDAAAYTDGLDG